MRTVKLGRSNLDVPAVGIGCMRLNSLDLKQAECFVKSALDMGFSFFDHADIYGDGTCEEIFANAVGMNSTVREKLIIQSKCGIVPGVMYDFSKEHILKSVDGSLKRLKTDYLDVLLLHRPDALVEPDEVADAFDTLYKSGKVRLFGVSNHKPMQIELLKKHLNQDIVANQLQLSITNSQMIRNGLEVNMFTEGSLDRDGSVLDYCRLNDITIQTWSPFQYGFFEGVFLNNDRFQNLNNVINALCEKYCCSNTAIATAWILRHPANMQMISGTTNVDRLKEIFSATDISLTKEEWYKIYLSAGNTLP
jgi:predicted oxidoreductase